MICVGVVARQLQFWLFSDLEALKIKPYSPPLIDGDIALWLAITIPIERSQCDVLKNNTGCGCHVSSKSTQLDFPNVWCTEHTRETRPCRLQCSLCAPHY